MNEGQGAKTMDRSLIFGRLLSVLLVQVSLFFFLAGLAFGEQKGCPKSSVKQASINGKVLKTRQMLREVSARFPESFKFLNVEKYASSDGLGAVIVNPPMDEGEVN